MALTVIALCRAPAVREERKIEQAQSYSQRGEVQSRRRMFGRSRDSAQRTGGRGSEGQGIQKRHGIGGIRVIAETVAKKYIGSSESGELCLLV